MHLVNCEHPIRVYNKYLGEYVWAPCKKCDTCLRRYQGKWTARLENERKSSLFTMFITLTYSDKYLPRLHRTGVDADGKLLDGEYYADSNYTFCIPFNDFNFETPADLAYFNDKMAHGGVPYADFTHITKFCKRLNKYIHDNYTNEYENFRYFICSELGKESLRPHYHGLLFFRKEIKTKDFEEDLRKVWTYGNIKCECVESTASSYVSKYVGKPAFYPSFYQHRKITPKFVCSKRPPIGSLYKFSESVSEVFHNTTTKTLLPSNDGHTLRYVPLPTYYQNWVFPKVPRFATISHSLRVGVYRASSYFYTQPPGTLSYEQVSDFAFTLPKERRYESILDWNNSFVRDNKIGSKDCRFLKFDDWYAAFREFVFRNYSLRLHSDLWSFLIALADGFTTKGRECLRRLYYVSKRVCRNCAKFGVSLEYYVLQIEKFYNKKELEILGSFYDFQQTFCEKNSSEELVNMYSEFNFNNPSDLPALSECSDYQSMCRDSHINQYVDLFSHFKNALVASCRCKDLTSKKLTLKFYYAKKCNEVIEAVT